MPYINSKGEERYTNLEKYDHFKGIADSGVVPARVLQDGTTLPARTLTNTEISRYADKANRALGRHRRFMETTKHMRATNPLPTARQPMASPVVAPVKPTKPKKNK